MTTYWFKDPMVASLAPVAQATALRGLGKKIFMPRLFIGDRFISTAPLLAPGPGMNWPQDALKEKPLS